MKSFEVFVSERNAGYKYVEQLVSKTQTLVQQNKGF